MNDIEIEEAPGPTDEQLRTVAALVRHQIMCQREVEVAEAQLAKAQEAFKQVSEEDLPNAMSAAGTLQYTYAGNRPYIVRISDKIMAHTPKQLGTAPFDWLRKTNNDSIIKHEIKVTFGKGESKEARRVLAWLQANAKPGKVTEKEAIHSSTLAAFIREQFAAMSDDVKKLFGVYVKRCALIEAPKEAEVVE